MVRGKLTGLIESHQESSIDDEKRQYIGASAIGSECSRKIWYEYKGYPSENVPAKILRTWAIGKRLEGLVIKWLLDTGANVIVSDKTYMSKKIPIFQGHFDGIIEIDGANYILEIKTAKDASFNIFAKKGVIGWNKQYYSQVQAYMGMSGISSAYILVLNKDNSELSDELVPFDEEYYKQLEERAISIANYENEPARINNSPLFFQCKMCKFNNICHK